MISHVLVAMLSPKGTVVNSIGQAPGECCLAMGQVPASGPLVFANHTFFHPCSRASDYFNKVQGFVYSQVMSAPTQIWAVHREPVLAPLRAAYRANGKPWTHADAQVKCMIDDLAAPTPWDIQRRKDVMPEALEILLNGSCEISDDVALMSEIPVNAREFFTYLKLLQFFLK